MNPRRAELLRLHRRLLATCLEPCHPERPAWQARLVALLAGGVRPCVPRETVTLGTASMGFAFVPPGTFLMGSPPGEPRHVVDEVEHRVTLTQGYFLGVHAVTQAQWRAVMSDHRGRFEGDDLPVDTLSWGACRAFCDRLSGQAGHRFRLPPEAEWENACRAGTTTPFFFGETISTDQAKYDDQYAYGGGTKRLS